MLDIPPILHDALAGRYVLKREIGRGGAATVYLAHDVRHERLVAIKVLHPELAHALGAQRFLREIKLTASLQHPHILPIHDSGEADGNLYYVMPYVEGDSLRQRLGADNRLSLEEAVRVGREVAGALAYAHERGVVHRDIKPENILFSGGHAVLADFGIARTVDREKDKITQQGTITGTPAYMSPEQARDRAFDGRSDVYSLACVLYEAIAGVPPFVGDTPQQLLQQRISKTPPLLREYRHDVPPPIEAVIAKALSISPDDRYDDARAFSAALSAAVGHSGETLTGGVHPVRPRRLWAWAAGIVLLAAGAVATTPKGRDQLGVLAGRVDTARYAVIPFQYAGTPSPVTAVEPAAGGLYEALRRWDGLKLASDVSVSDALRDGGDATPTLDEIAQAARSVRAGRFVWGRVRRSHDSLVVRADLYNALTGESLREVTRIVPMSADAVATLDFRGIGAELLRDSRGALMSSRADLGTSSFPAWQAFERGQAALVRWDVATASAALDSAVTIDPGYPQANLWLAQIRFWMQSSPSQWTAAYAAADRGRALLDPRERALTDALAAVSREDYPGACRSYGALRQADSLDVVAWLGLALCQARDQAVVRDARSPSGWVYRSSYESAWRATRRALDLAPAAFSVLPYEFLRQAIQVESNRRRLGILGSEQFGGTMSLAGDTMAFVPFPLAISSQLPPSESNEAALRLNRDRMLSLLETLTRRLPESADAFEAFTNLLETRDEITGTPNGRYSALSALERARMLSQSPDQRIRLAASDVRLHLKLGDFARATATADSVLRAQHEPTEQQAYLLTGLAAYLGRTELAARYFRLGGMQEFRAGIDPVPAAEEAVAALFMRAALGVCDDSVRSLPAVIDRALESYVGSAKRPMVRERLLERPTMLAAQCTGPEAALRITHPFSTLIRLEQVAARDRPALLQVLDSLDATRRSVRPGTLSFDSVVQEAWLADYGGDPARAARRLDVVLTALPTLSTYIVTEPGMAAALGRGMAYRAELASRLGDASTAAMWASRVLTVWSRADANLAPTLARMRRIAARQSL